MRVLALLLALAIIPGCTAPDEGAPAAEAEPEPADAPTSASPTEPSVEPSPSTPTPSQTPAPTASTPPPESAAPTPPPALMRIEKSFGFEIPAAIENDRVHPIYTSNCVDVEGAEATVIAGGHANATWSATGGPASTLDLISNPTDVGQVNENVTRVTGPSPLSLGFTYERTNETGILLQLPQGTPAAAVQQKGTIALVIYYTGPEPSFRLMGCTLRVSS